MCCASRLTVQLKSQSDNLWCPTWECSTSRAPREWRWMAKRGAEWPMMWGRARLGAATKAGSDLRSRTSGDRPPVNSQGNSTLHSWNSSLIKPQRDWRISHQARQQRGEEMGWQKELVSLGEDVSNTLWNHIILFFRIPYQADCSKEEDRANSLQERGGGLEGSKPGKEKNRTHTVETQILWEPFTNYSNTYHCCIWHFVRSGFGSWDPAGACRKKPSEPGHWLPTFHFLPVPDSLQPTKRVQWHLKGPQK